LGVNPSRNSELAFIINTSLQESVGKKSWTQVKDSVNCDPWVKRFDRTT
jgi:hypothetical protein